MQSPDGQKYYFKQSYKKEVIDYKYEFWSEIIAAEVGKELGFDVLQYDLATDGSIMGCICLSMIENDEQELNEGGKYLQAFDNTFEPEIKTTRAQYSFQLVQQAFQAFRLDEYMDKFIHMLIFDALIGNSDRHQENWAFITTHGKVSSLMSILQKESKDPNWKKNLAWLRKLPLAKKLFKEDTGELVQDVQLIKLYFQNVQSFSPIYDSGSSLGRELSIDKVQQMLTDKMQLDAYLRRGTSEIHWDGKKLNHFDLIKNIMGTSYAEIVHSQLSALAEKFDGTKIEQIVKHIDDTITNPLSHYKLPEPRKELITKMIILRSQKLSGLLMKAFDKIYLTWRQGQAHRRHIVGVLQKDSDGKFTFRYFKDKVDEAKKQGFSTYTEFPDADKVYNSNVVDIFAQRLTKAERIDVQKLYDFWEVDLKYKDDKFYLLGQTQGLVPTDNFEFLADYQPGDDLHFLTEVAGLSDKKLPADVVLPGDKLRFELEPSNQYDPEAVKVFKGDKEIGYIKKVHCKLFHKPGAENLKLEVKAVDKNGVIKRIFIKVSN